MKEIEGGEGGGGGVNTWMNVDEGGTSVWLGTGYRYSEKV